MYGVGNSEHQGNRRDAPSVSFATEPLHGLFCKRRWRRVCYRHNWVRNALAASLNRMPGVQAVLEPMVTTRRAPGDQRRGDIKVIKSGTSWILDVGIICPGSQRLVSKGTDIIPGKAAALYEDKKTKTYSDQANFVPFIVETGGRNQRGRPAAACNSSPGSCRWRPRARLDSRGGMDVLHCAASHGHWRFSRATCLHRLPRRYTRLYGGGGQQRVSGPGSRSR